MKTFLCHFLQERKKRLTYVPPHQMLRYWIDLNVQVRSRTYQKLRTEIVIQNHVKNLIIGLCPRVSVVLLAGRVSEAMECVTFVKVL